MSEKILAPYKIWKETQRFTHFEKIFLGKGRKIYMNKRLSIIGITLLLITTGLSGCIDEKLTEAPLTTLALTLDDLPEGYIKQAEGNKSFEGPHDIIALEAYKTIFTSPISPPIELVLSKFNSSENARIVLYNLSEWRSSSSVNKYNRTTPQNVKQIGDESSYELFQSSPTSSDEYTHSYVYFRIANVVVYLSLRENWEREIDYVNLTINYAEIVESKIYASLK